MSKEKLESRQAELKKEAEALITERSKLSKRIGEINTILQQKEGAYQLLIEQLEELNPKEEKPKK